VRFNGSVSCALLLFSAFLTRFNLTQDLDFYPFLVYLFYIYLFSSLLSILSLSLFSFISCLLVIPCLRRSVLRTCTTFPPTLKFIYSHHLVPILDWIGF
jgi:hypothetical protein